MNTTQRKLVVWGLGVMAVVIHLTFWDWGCHYDHGYSYPSLGLFNCSAPAGDNASERLERNSAYKAVKYGFPWPIKFGLEARYRGLWSPVFGIVLPLGLLGAAIYIRLGGRRGE